MASRELGIYAGAEGGMGQGDQAETMEEGRSWSELLRSERRDANRFPEGKEEGFENWREYAYGKYPWK